jgi:hypothetical protein
MALFRERGHAGMPRHVIEKTQALVPGRLQRTHLARTGFADTVQERFSRSRTRRDSRIVSPTTLRGASRFSQRSLGSLSLGLCAAIAVLAVRICPAVLLLPAHQAHLFSPGRPGIDRLWISRVAFCDPMNLQFRKQDARFDASTLLANSFEE